MAKRATIHVITTATTPTNLVSCLVIDRPSLRRLDVHIPITSAAASMKTTRCTIAPLISPNATSVVDKTIPTEMLAVERPKAIAGSRFSISRMESAMRALPKIFQHSPRVRECCDEAEHGAQEHCYLAVCLGRALELKHRLPSFGYEHAVLSCVIRRTRQNRLRAFREI